MTNTNSESHVLVTGGAGYIGSHAVLALCERGERVVVVDNLSTGLPFMIPQNVPFENVDIGDSDKIAAILARYKVSAILHFAGSIVVSESVADPLKYYRNNSANTAALLSCAVAAKVRHFVFSSTAAVYGNPDTIPISEDARKAPVNPYGMSKLMTEAMLADVAATGALNYGVLRYFNVAGADPQARCGEPPAGDTHLIKAAVQSIVRAERSCVTQSGAESSSATSAPPLATIRVFGTDYNTPDGSCVRDYIHVADLAAAHVDALDYLVANERENLIINCGYGRGYSVLEVLDTIDKVADCKLDRDITDRRAGDPDILVADSGRIRATLPWQPHHDSLETIVRDALHWERKLATLIE